jgi:aryl-alcohol dehydrogenase-like predicted oxidoreductase
VAIAAALSQPWADTILVGPATTEQLASNLGALKLDDIDLDQLSTVDESAADYWATRASLPWA